MDMPKVILVIGVLLAVAGAVSFLALSGQNQSEASIGSALFSLGILTAAGGLYWQARRLQAQFQEQGWEWAEDLVFRDDGSSGASLKRASAGSLTGASGAGSPGSGRDSGSRPTGPEIDPSNAPDRSIGNGRLPGRVCRATDEPGST